MTIITKVITEKKIDPDKQELVKNELDAVVVAPPPVLGEEEVSAHVYLTLPPLSQRRCCTANTLLAVLLILGVCAVGGLILNQHYAQSKMYRFKTWCNVPFELEEADPQPGHMFGNDALTKSQEDEGYEVSSETLTIPTSFFKEDFEMDLRYEAYEKIDVPNFRGGRHGRFIHDFSSNKTGIIDLDGQRCFVMPLNRSQVLPPQSLFDLVLKMKAGYYEVDTAVVRETMRVVQPPISDYRSVGYYISRECSSLPTYRLRRIGKPVVLPKVFKRSVEKNSVTFTEFAGKNIIQIQIVN